MKKIILILIIIAIPIIGSCQQKTLKYYNSKSWDSLLVIRNNYQTQANNLSATNATLTTQLASANASLTTANNSIKSLNNTLAARDAQIILQTNYEAKLLKTIDSLKLIKAFNIKLGTHDTISFITDTANFKIVWDETNGSDVLICKDAKDFKFVFIDTDKNRIYLQKADTALQLSVYKNNIKTQSPKFKL
jgi:hypothetical protein